MSCASVSGYKYICFKFITTLMIHDRGSDMIGGDDDNRGSIMIGGALIVQEQELPNVFTCCYLMP